MFQLMIILLVARVICFVYGFCLIHIYFVDITVLGQRIPAVILSSNTWYHGFDEDLDLLTSQMYYRFYGNSGGLARCDGTLT